MTEVNLNFKCTSEYYCFMHFYCILDYTIFNIPNVISHSHVPFWIWRGKGGRQSPFLPF